MQRLGREASLTSVFRTGLFVGAAVAAGALGFALARFLPGAGPPAAGAPAPAVALRPVVSGEFSLLDTAGRTVRWAEVGGRWQLVFFGFTSCPEACPVTLGNAVQALGDPGLDGQDLRVLFISVDPGRDTPPVVRDYVGRFGTRVTGLTGDPAGIAAAAAAFGVYFEQLPAMADGDYMVEHTASLFLLDPADGIVATIPYGTSAAGIAAAVQRHIQPPGSPQSPGFPLD